MKLSHLIAVLTGVAACVFLTPAHAAQDQSVDAGKVCSPFEYGGVAGDGQPDTGAIQAAIATCAGTGGRVEIGKGVWDIGLIRLGSDMEFHLAEGSVLRLIPDIEAFPRVDSTLDPANPNTVLTAIFGFKVSNLTISGTGRIEGNGAAFWDPDFYNTGLKRPTLPRPEPTLELVGCRNVVVRDITMVDLASFAIRFRNCDTVRAEGVTIANDPRSPNTDGIQIRDTDGAIITGVDIRTGDDAIVLKSRSRVTRNVIVENSYLESDDGALKFGTSSHMGFQDNIFRDITIADSRYGIAIFMIDGGRHANNRFERISIATGGRHRRTYPIFMDIDRREADRRFGEIEGFVFEDINIRSRGSVLVAGNPSAPIRDVTLRRVRVAVPEDAEDLVNGSTKPRGNKDIKDQAGSVDYARTAANLVFGHIEGLRLEEVSVSVADEDTNRAGIALIDVKTDGAPQGSYVAGDTLRDDFIEKRHP